MSLFSIAALYAAIEIRLPSALSGGKNPNLIDAEQTLDYHNEPIFPRYYPGFQINYGYS